MPPTPGIRRSLPETPTPSKARAGASLSPTPPDTKGRTFPAEVLTPEEVRALLGTCGSLRNPTPIRNRALIVLLWRSGLRVSEALALRPVDLDLKRGTVRVLRGKGGKARTVGLDDFAHDALALWLERRPAKRGAPLFVQITKGREGQPLSANYVRHMLKRLARKAGVER